MKRKPYNMKYTDLCIYIDNTVYDRDENNNPIGLRDLSNIEVEKVYNYLYNIIYALSLKKKLFTKSKDYDDFSIEAAGTIYLRLTAKNQNYNQDAIKNKAIKSILNYIKSTLPFMAITWRNTYYCDTINPDIDSLEDTFGAQCYVYKQASAESNYNRKKAFQDLFADFPKYIKESLANSIFKKNNILKYEITLSEYLSILNLLTLEHKFKDISDNRKCTKIENQFNNRKDYIINYSNNPMVTKEIIDLQLRKTLFLLEDEKNSIDSYYTPSDQELNNILSSAFPTYGTDQTGD